ncbi:unnamed protein product [Ranitomeya imitator]|uniref:Uncharacterized protein n=1 Tax=Ranitomeya imitator TaxID=111125 RepID=A0ABN9MJV6_9NEOB|nr:unnamed protein product [Ranitomeya imitator]
MRSEETRLGDGAGPSGPSTSGGFQIALGNKGQTSESKAPPNLMKPAAPGLTSERKREARFFCFGQHIGN